jgi:hypothetical protein
LVPDTGYGRQPGRFTLLLAAVLLCCPFAAAAADEEPQVPAAEQEPPRPQHRIYYDNILLLRYNPLGVEDWFNIGYRYRLYRHDSAALRDNHVGLAFTPTLSPGVLRFGGTLEFKPLSVLTLSMGYYFVTWLGTFEFLQSYPSASAEHSDSDQDRGKDDGLTYATNGSELQLKAQPVIKVGPVVLRDEINFFYANMQIHERDRTYYNIRIDLLMPNRGWALTNDTDLVWLSDFGLVAGVRSTVVHALYTERHFYPPEDRDNMNSPTWRLGPLLAYVFSDDLDPGFNKPTLLLIVNWWLRNRYRTGADVHQGVPYVILGFKFEGDLWTAD